MRRGQLRPKHIDSAANWRVFSKQRRRRLAVLATGPVGLIGKV